MRSADSPQKGVVMNPLLMGLMSGGASLLGSVFSSQTSAANTQAQIQAQEQMQSQTEQFNAGQAQLQRDYQTQMSNTAYQRATKDMEAAGLNPAMMYGGGSAASTPAGSSASVGTPSVPMPSRTSALSGVGPAMDQALHGAVTAKTVDLLTEEVAKAKAATGLAVAEAGAAGARTKLTGTEEERVAQDIKVRTPAEMEAQGVTNLGAQAVGLAGKAKYFAGTASDVIAPVVSSALGVGRIGQAFQAIENMKLGRDIKKSNFIDKYGTPVGEYLSDSGAGLGSYSFK